VEPRDEHRSERFQRCSPTGHDGQRLGSSVSLCCGIVVLGRNLDVRGSLDPREHLVVEDRRDLGATAAMSRAAFVGPWRVRVSCREHGHLLTRSEPDGRNEVCAADGAVADVRTRQVRDETLFGSASAGGRCSIHAGDTSIADGAEVPRRVHEEPSRRAAVSFDMPA
jgi:hypothetical protein